MKRCYSGSSLGLETELINYEIRSQPLRVNSLLKNISHSYSQKLYWHKVSEQLIGQLCISNWSTLPPLPAILQENCWIGFICHRTSTAVINGLHKSIRLKGHKWMTTVQITRDQLEAARCHKNQPCCEWPICLHLTFGFHSFCQVTQCQRTYERFHFKKQFHEKLWSNFESFSYPLSQKMTSGETEITCWKTVWEKSWNSFVNCENKQNFIHRIQMCDRSAQRWALFVPLSVLLTPICTAKHRFSRSQLYCVYQLFIAVDMHCRETYTRRPLL